MPYTVSPLAIRPNDKRPSIVRLRLSDSQVFNWHGLHIPVTYRGVVMYGSKPVGIVAMKLVDGTCIPSFMDRFVQ